MRTQLQTVVVVDDDPIIGEGVGAGIQRAGRRVIVCRDIEGATLVMESEPVDAVIADIQYRGEFSFDGLDLVDTLKKALPKVPIFLMTGAGHQALENEARKRGAAGFFRKPFSIDELERVLPEPSGDTTEENRVTVPEIDDLLEQDLIRLEFQPVFHLVSGERIGFEALARPVTESLFRSPEILFRYAVSRSRTLDLERLCVKHAVHLARRIPEQYLLFVNLHPDSLATDSIVRIIEKSIEEEKLEPSRLVLEITEHGAIGTSKSLEQIESLKSLGISFALDDIGSAFSHLNYIAEIAPAWMKVSQLFGTGFESNTTKSKIVSNVADLASSFDAKLILEGIETEETAIAAAELGIEYGQGYHLARPARLETFGI